MAAVSGNSWRLTSSREGSVRSGEEVRREVGEHETYDDDGEILWHGAFEVARAARALAHLERAYMPYAPDGRPHGTLVMPLSHLPEVVYALGHRLADYDTGSDSAYGAYARFAREAVVASQLAATIDAYERAHMGVPADDTPPAVSANGAGAPV
jgi:hypothetical protein